MRPSGSLAPADTLRAMWSPSAPPRDDGGTFFFCSIHAEARSIRRGSGLPKSRVLVAGPGADAMTRAVEQAPDDVTRALLLGYASGLDATTARGVHAVERVIGVDGHALLPSWIVPQLPRTVLVSVPELPSTPDEKSELAARCGAALADRVGHAFATAAARRRWRWGIVRAVFDGPDLGYPAGFDRTVRPNGRTRPLRALLWSLELQRRNSEAQALVRNFMAGAKQMSLVAKAVAVPGPSGLMERP